MYRNLKKPENLLVSFLVCSRLMYSLLLSLLLLLLLFILFILLLLLLLLLYFLFVMVQTRQEQKKLATWSTEDVCRWLVSLDLELYCESFRQNAIDGEELSHMEGEVLASDLGIGKQCFFAISNARVYNEHLTRSWNLSTLENLCWDGRIFLDKVLLCVGMFK